MESSRERCLRIMDECRIPDGWASDGRTGCRRSWQQKTASRRRLIVEIKAEPTKGLIRVSSMGCTISVGPNGETLQAAIDHVVEWLEKHPQDARQVAGIFL
jgi:hypothetical protein